MIDYTIGSEEGRHEPGSKPATPYGSPTSPDERLGAMLDSRPFFDLLNVRVQLWTESALTDWTCHAASIATHCQTVANVNLHSLCLAQESAELRECIGSAEAVHIDGMAVIVLCRLLGIPARREHRVTYIDWLDPLLANAARDRLRVFFLGSRPGIGEQAGEIIRRRHPELQIASHHGYFDVRRGSRENTRVVDRIHRFDADLLLVGMGMPRQERWILENRDRLRVGVCLPCGATMDYLTRAIPTPPRWTGQLGIEWIYRLAAEPRRLAHRYLVEPWALLPPITASLYRRWILRG